MRIFGIIGYPLSHSFSPGYFKDKFQNEKITDAEYRTFPLAAIQEFPSIIKNIPGICGLNVTIPYKETIIPYLDKLHGVANEIKAVNCIKITRGNKMIGFNTDVHGFENSIQKYLKPHHTKALILGTGGASKAIAYVLKKLNLPFVFVTRTKVSAVQTNLLNYDRISGLLVRDYALIINTTPLGMYGSATDEEYKNSCPPLPYGHFTEKHLLFDLVYNPAETLFLKKGKMMGATVVNGLEMLHLQAEKCWELWNETE